DALPILAGISDFPLIAQHLDRLSFLDLLEPAVLCDWVGKYEQNELTPTRLGLKFYARCRGLLDPPDVPRLHTESMVQFQAVQDTSNFAHEEPLRMYAPAS